MGLSKRLETSSLILLLREKANSYCADNISNYYEHWRSITSDKYILSIVQNGLLLSFDKDQPSKTPFGFSRTDVWETEVEKLLKKGGIAPTKIKPDDCFSNLFTRQKKGGSYRTILNLKYLDEECYTQYFKMEPIRYAIYIIDPGMFLASLDTKDAFYSIPVHKTHQKFLKFLFKVKTFSFKAMSNGYLDAMRIFNKVLKPPFE